MTTKIQIKTRLHDGIYKSAGGGETRVVAEWTYGPRNLVKAFRHLREVRESNVRGYGNIGCGRTWLCTSDGRVLDSSLVFDDGTLSHADLVEEIEGSLRSPAEHRAAAAAVYALMDQADELDA